MVKEPLSAIVRRQEEVLEVQRREIKSLVKTLEERDKLLDDQREQLDILGRVEKALKEVEAAEKARTDGQLREAVRLAETQAITIQSLGDTVEDLRKRVKMLTGS